MIKYALKNPDHIIEIRQNYMDVTTMAGVEKDPDWTYIDRRGHVHTQETVATTLHWVEEEGTGHYCDDPCQDWHVNDQHRECVQCGEEIKPGMRSVSSQRSMMSGMTEVLIDGEPSTMEEARRLVEEAQQNG